MFIFTLRLVLPFQEIGMVSCIEIKLVKSDRRRDSAVSIATGYGLDDRGVAVRFPVRSTCLLRVVQTGTGAHPASYLMFTELVPRSRKCGSIHPLPHTPSWRSA
jgi:hypothetical protein